MTDLINTDNTSQVTATQAALIDSFTREETDHLFDLLSLNDRPVRTPTQFTRDCVARGAAWLDTVKPEWYTLVNVEDLYLATVDKCICGWVFKDDVPLNSRGLPMIPGYNYAFQKYGHEWDRRVPDDKRDFMGGCSWFGFAGGEMETDLWRMEIANRYAQNAA